MSVKRIFIKRVAVLTLAMLGLGLVTGVGTVTVLGQEEPGQAHNETVTDEQENEGVRWDVAIAIAAAISIPCLAAGYAVGKVGAAALGAASEKPELLGRSLTFVALGEGIAIFGFVLALLLSGKL